MPLQNLVNEALRAHASGQLDIAESRYNELIAKNPDHAEAIHLFGVLLHQRGDSERGLALIQNSLSMAPNASGFNDLGNILTQLNRIPSALKAFEKAIELAPVNAVFWNNLGAVQQQLNQLDAAEHAFRHAVEIAPEQLDALTNLGNLLATRGKTNEAAEYHCRAYLLSGPTQDKPKKMLGIAYYRLNRIKEAAATYRQWLEEEPGNPVAAHLYAACAGQQTPSRASNAYIEKTFNEFAERFEENLVAQLGYNGHEMIGHALRRLGLPRATLNGLDAGCGTGLCGPVVRPYVHKLIGIDLSAQILALARQKNSYDELINIELSVYMRAHPNEFDLIVAADTLIYFGELDSPLSAMRNSLKKDGIVICTFEEALDINAGYKLNPSGRYSHDRAYLSSLFEGHRLKIVSMEPFVVRQEFERPVQALIITAQKH